MIEKFVVPDLDKEYLASKLNNVRYPNEYEDPSVGWKCGAPTWAVKDMVKAWKTYNWDTARAEINSWNHYKTLIEDLNIHFIHEPSTDPNATAIILIHGWPSTFYEFHKMIEPLKDQGFHVVVPSLPGYGFSDAPKRQGEGSIGRFAEIMHKVMIELGYKKYMIYGTDWGAAIGERMSQNHPDSILGFLCSMPFVYPPPILSAVLRSPIKVFKLFLSLVLGFAKVYGPEVAALQTLSFANVDKSPDAAYRAIQSARPYTLAYGLTDSPVGLLGWMLEPYHAWTYHPSEEETTSIPNTLTTDEFLTQVSIYWMTNTMASSYRLYHEHVIEAKTLKPIMFTIPLAISYFIKEMVQFPREWFELSGRNLLQFKRHDQGGHFPALEVPDKLLGDIFEFRSILNKNSQKKDI